MNEPIPASNVTQPNPEAASVSRWSLFVVPLAGLFFPATTAQRTRHVSLRGAWLFHFVSILVLTALVLFLIAWGEAGGHLDPALVASEFSDLLAQITSEFRKQPGMSVLAVLGMVCALELTLMALAWQVMPWGARDEPIRASYRNALRQTWLHFATLIPVVLVLAPLGITSERLQTEWQRDHSKPVRPTQPSPPSLPASEQQLDDYETARAQHAREVARFQRARARWRTSQTWYIRDWGVVIVVLSFASAMWVLFAFLRGVGAPRNVPPIERPPMCDDCGYNLSTIPMDSRCPECGEPIIASLGPDVRPGAIWQHRREVGAIKSWRRCAVEAIVNPTALGRRLQLRSPGTDHRRFVLLHLPIIFVLGAAGLLTIGVIEGGVDQLREEPVIVLGITAIVGISCVVGALGVILFSAGL
ncbi:MAG: hypothetical protein IID38_11980, partial [Planctomycetes bacterium]|nr:hypothetical protein [Planctomycetota bacterium]